MPRFSFLAFGTGTKNKNKSTTLTSSSKAADNETPTPTAASSDTGSSQIGSASTDSTVLSTSSNRHRSNIASTTMSSSSIPIVGGKSSVVDIPHLPPGLPSSYQYNFDYITKGASALGGNGGRISTSSGAVRSGSGSSASLRSKRRSSSISLTSRASLAAPPPVALRRDVGHHSAGGMVGWQSSHQDQNMFGSQYGMALPRKLMTTSTETINAYEQNLRRRSTSFTYHQCYSSPSLATLPGLSPTDGQSESDTDPERESLSSLSSSSSYSSGNSEYDSPPTSGTPSPASSPPDRSNPLVEIESSRLFQEFSSPARRAALEREFEEERRRREAEHTRLLRWRYVAGILLSRSSGKPISRSATILNAPQGLGLEIDAADEVRTLRIRKGYVKSSLSTVVVLEVQ